MTADHQFWAPRKTGGGDTPRNVQLWATVGSSNVPWPWPWPWIGSRSNQRTRYVEYYQLAQPSDCSVTQYRNVSFEFREIWTQGEVWTLVIAFLEGKSKIWLRQAVVQVPYYDHRPSVLNYQRTQPCDCSITHYRNRWPFQCREISTFREVWTLMIPFLEGNSKIGLRQAVDQVPYCQCQPSVLSSTRKWRRR